MSINERLKRLRKDQELNQGEFGERIGLKQGAISKMEQEGNAVIDQNIRLICDTFNVSEHWLRTGEGEMYEESDDVLLKQLSTQYKLEGGTLELIKNFLMLTAEQRAAILHAANIIADANKKAMETAAAKAAATTADAAPAPADAPPVSDSVTPPSAITSPAVQTGIPPTPEYYTPPGYEVVPEIEEKVKKFRAKLYAEESARRKLSTSTSTAPSSEREPEMKKAAR